MVIVTATLQVPADRLDEAISKGLEHVRRSRAEPGCLSHDLSQSAEDPTVLTFVERWQDRDALARHFVVAEAVAFARALGALAVSRPDMTLYEAEPFNP
jgi:quinol monooxygenase YgiN